nr:proline-, glutamic acid- and leucine-rich protein 1 [Ciona intestinalis]|eukprot:XP_009859350.1 proline-, glutamic acid- and leucine-rich protein 1 [Ciona intestinalis]
MEDVVCSAGNDLHSILSLISKKDWRNKEEIHQVNTCLRAGPTKCVGLVAMKNILSQCDASTVLKDGISWLHICCETATSPHEDDSSRQVAAENFHEILKYSKNLAELSRKLSTETISQIMSKLISLKPTDHSNKHFLICLEAVLKFFPGPCGPFKGKIAKCLASSMLSLESELRKFSVRCWSYIPVLGGGGTGRRNHVMQWQQQITDILDCLDHICSCLFDDHHNEEILDPSLLMLSIQFPPLSKEEPLLSNQLIQRLFTFCECLSSLLEVNLPAQVEIPFERIFYFLLSCFNVNPKQLGFTSEKILRSSYLCDIHMSCLNVFDVLTRQCRQHISRHSSALNQIFLNLLTLWRDRTPMAGRTNLFSEIRLQIYNSVSCWIKCCGSKSNFLCGESHVVEPMLELLIKDILPTPDNIKLSGQGENLYEKNRNKNKLNNLTGLSGSRIFDNSSNWEVCTKALEVGRLCVLYLGPQLSVNVHKMLQESVVAICMKLIQKDPNLQPYNSCESVRLQLYHLLLSLTISSSPSWPSPLQYSSRIFSHGSNHDQSPDVRFFCTEACITLTHVTHPRSAPMHRTSSTFGEDCLKVWEAQAVKVPQSNVEEPVDDITPINLPLHCNDNIDGEAGKVCASNTEAEVQINSQNIDSDAENNITCETPEKLTPEIPIQNNDNRNNKHEELKQQQQEQEDIVMSDPSLISTNSSKQEETNEEVLNTSSRKRKISDITTENDEIMDDSSIVATTVDSGDKVDAGLERMLLDFVGVPAN